MAAVRVTVHLTSGPPLTYESTSEELTKIRGRLAERFVTFDLLDATALLNRDHIVRIDVDKET